MSKTTFIYNGEHEPTDDVLTFDDAADAELLETTAAEDEKPAPDWVNFDKPTKTVGEKS